MHGCVEHKEQWKNYKKKEKKKTPVLLRRKWINIKVYNCLENNIVSPRSIYNLSLYMTHDNTKLVKTKETNLTN